MSESGEKHIYYIPDNFAEEGRVFQGAVRIKNLIQGIAVALPFAILGWACGKVLTGKIMLSISLAGPMLCLGIVGYNGDPLFTAVRNLASWVKLSGIRQYNSLPVPFYSSPTDVIFSEEPARDKIVGVYESRQQQKIEQHLHAEMIEGETFVFAEDPTIAKYHRYSEKPVETGSGIKKLVIEDSDIRDLFDCADWVYSCAPEAGAELTDNHGGESS